MKQYIRLPNGQKKLTYLYFIGDEESTIQFVDQKYDDIKDFFGMEIIDYVAINEQISNFAQTYPTNLKASSNEALLFMRRYRFANCSCFSCCFKDAYPSSNVQ